MRAHLFSTSNKTAEEKESHTIWFCDMNRCGELVEISSTAVLQYFCGNGTGHVFLGNGEICLQNAVGIFGNGDVCLYPKPESETCLFCEEFVSGVVHLVCCYRHYAVLSCGGVSFEVLGWDFKSCDCVNENGVDYIFLKFENRLSCVLWNGEGYGEVFNIPATDFEVSRGVCKVKFSPLISGCAVLYCEIALSKALLPHENFKFEKFKLETPENFNFFTFENYFFELLFVARMLEQNLAKKLLSKYLADGLKSEIGGILEFLGEFCGVVPNASGGVILIYQKSQTHFETRMLKIEIFYNKEGSPVVENISEDESFQFARESFQDLSKTMLDL